MKSKRRLCCIERKEHRKVFCLLRQLSGGIYGELLGSSAMPRGIGVESAFVKDRRKKLYYPNGKLTMFAF